MPHVITQSCCNDGSCVRACPVNCIHPGVDEPGFAAAESLYIDPDACIDCGACVPECPVDAIVPDDQLRPGQRHHLELSRAYYQQHPRTPHDDLRELRTEPRADLRGIRVAVVGTGPAGFYAAEELLNHRGCEIDMYDRDFTPYGLVRYGVAPDHPATKLMVDAFERTVRKPQARLLLGVEIGRHITPEELRANYSAVIYATGATGDRLLGIDGEELRGVHGAGDFVGWYNGHPGHADHQFDLSGDRAVIVGNGNVALDIARILVSNPRDLARTDIADHALDALSHSGIREVVVLGRRGTEQAAYTVAELLALRDLPDVDVVVEGAQGDDRSAKARAVRDIAHGPRRLGARRIVLRFLSSPLRLSGNGRVQALHLSCNALATDSRGTIRARIGPESETLETRLVIRSVGFRGAPIDGMPFDPQGSVIPNESGRVAQSGRPMDGVYVTGWIKRGSSGVIGTNRACARETVAALLADVAAGIVTSAPRDRGFDALLAQRQPLVVDYARWNRIDAAESRAGHRRGRPRVKLTTVSDLLEAAGINRDGSSSAARP